MFSKLIQPNPKLKVLRKEGLEAPQIDYDLRQLLEKTKRLHAGWLFDFDYLVLLQKLCRMLDGNFESYISMGWASFGHHLGLSSEVIKVIECSKLGNEGYTYYVLQHYIQRDDATIQKVIQALQNIKRLDVIQQTHLYFNDLAVKVFQTQERLPVNQQSDEEDGYYSGLSNGEENENREQEDNQVLRNVEECIIKPNFIPTPALVLQVLEEHVCRATPQIFKSQVCRIEQERLQTSAVNRSPRNIQVLQDNKLQTLQKDETLQKHYVQEYDCKVMLTFAADGIKYAIEVARALRAKREKGQNFGVLILDEHQLVESNPELFISGSFPQVDYVIPIITEGYLQAAMDTSSPLFNESPYIDCKYVRFIYTLMNKYYVQNGCLNKKIRCIIPDDLTKLTYKTLMREPIFEAWVKYSNVDTLAERMFWRCERKRNSRPQINEA